MSASNRTSRVRPDLGIKPGAGVNPPAFGGGLGNSQHPRGFLNGHPDEITQLHQFGLFLVQRSQFVERLINGQHLVVGCGRGDFEMLDIERGLTGTVTQGLLATGVFDENTAHGFSGCAEEMRAAVPGLVLAAPEPQPGFMHQRRGLQRLARGFMGHFASGELAQFIIDQRQQLARSFGIALLHGVEDAGNVTHLPFAFDGGIPKMSPAASCSRECAMIPSFQSIRPGCASFNSAILMPSARVARAELVWPDWYSAMAWVA